MKTSKIDRVVDGLKAEARIVQDCIGRLDGCGSDAQAVLSERLGVLNELVTRLSEVDEAELNTPKRTRKARKAGLPASE